MYKVNLLFTAKYYDYVITENLHSLLQVDSRLLVVKWPVY